MAPKQSKIVDLASTVVVMDGHQEVKFFQLPQVMIIESMQTLKPLSEASHCFVVDALTSFTKDEIAQITVATMKREFASAGPVTSLIITNTPPCIRTVNKFTVVPSLNHLPTTSTSEPEEVMKLLKSLSRDSLEKVATAVNVATKVVRTGKVRGTKDRSLTEIRADLMTKFNMKVEEKQAPVKSVTQVVFGEGLTSSSSNKPSAMDTLDFRR